MYLLQVVLRLARVINFVLVLRHSTGNCSNLRHCLTQRDTQITMSLYKGLINAHSAWATCDCIANNYSLFYKVYKVSNRQRLHGEQGDECHTKYDSLFQWFIDVTQL